MVWYIFSVISELFPSSPHRISRLCPKSLFQKKETHESQCGNVEIDFSPLSALRSVVKEIFRRKRCSRETFYERASRTNRPT